MKKFLFFIFCLFANMLVFGQAIEVDSSGNVGVGTSTPQNYGGYKTVDVSGSGAGQAGRVQVKTFDSSVKGLLGSQTNFVELNVPTNHPLIFKTNDTERMRIKNTGNVGIGTYDPQTLLEMAGTNPTITLRGDALSYYTSIRAISGAYGPNEGWLIDTYNGMRHVTNGWMQFATGASYATSTTRMSISPTGDVNINGSSLGFAQLEVSRGDNATVALIDNRAVAAGVGGGIYLGGNYTGTTKTTWAAILGQKENATDSDVAGYLSFLTRPSGGIHSEKMRITSTGNVGIGTSVPNAPLDIIKSQNRTSLTGPNRGILHLRANSSVPANNEVTAITFDDYSAGANSIIGSRFTPNGTNLFFGTSNSYVSGVTNTAMLIDYIGNIGIGTSTPTTIGTYSVLDVQGRDTTNGGLIQLKTSDSLVKGQVFSDIGGVSIGAATNHALRLFTNNTERIRIDNLGNVGIGTSAPAYGLDIKSGSITASPVFNATSTIANSGAVRIVSCSGAVGSAVAGDSLITNDFGNMFISPNATGKKLFLSGGIWGSNGLTIDGSNNVGIGTITPTNYGAGYKTLTIMGANTTDGGILELKTTDASRVFRVFNHAAAARIETLSNHPIEFYTTSNFRMLISSDGNVGIGTTTPTEKLEVNGAVKATSFKVGGTTLNVPDYVFEEGYKLKTLDEVQALIAEHGHLPGIPSAKEIKENGLDMTDMQLKLLEKVEELTLYTIDQNKEIQKLKEENKALKEKDALMEALLKRVEALERK